MVRDLRSIFLCVGVKALELLVYRLYKSLLTGKCFPRAYLCAPWYMEIWVHYLNKKQTYLHHVSSLTYRALLIREKNIY